MLLLQPLFHEIRSTELKGGEIENKEKVLNLRQLKKSKRELVEAQVK